MAAVEKRRMCPNCRAFITTSDKVCPYCDMKLGAPAVERRTPAAVGFIPAARFTTVVLLLINAGLFVATSLFSMNRGGGFTGIDIVTLLLFGASNPMRIAGGEWWRLITAGFLHGGILHILMNSWVIFDLGTTVEEFYGTARYLVFYFLSTVAGFAASAFWMGATSVGASAGLFGLIGAMIAFGLHHKGTSMGSAMRAHYTQWAVWGIAIGLIGNFQTDNAAHIGGLAAGFAAAWIAGPPPLAERWTGKAWKIAATLCVLLTLWAFAKMLLFLLGS